MSMAVPGCAGHAYGSRALVDRLTHRGHMLEMNAESYRFRKSMIASQRTIGVVDKIGKVAFFAIAYTTERDPAPLNRAASAGAGRHNRSLSLPARKSGAE